jgi:hypothetical protein
MASQDSAIAPPLLSLSSEQISVLRGAAPIATFAAVFAFAGVFLMRGGLDDGATGVSSILAFAILPVWLSTWALPRYSSDPLLAGMALSTSIFVGVLVPMSGLLDGRRTGISSIVLLFVMLGAAVPSLWKSVRTVGWKGFLSVPIFALLLIIFTEPQCLFHPETITLGVAHSDYYYHFTLSQMIAHYGISSIGADGLIFERYHFLSHAVAAGLAKAADVDIPVAYVYWGQLTLRFQTIWSVFCAGLLLFCAEDGRIAAAIASRFFYAWLAVILLLPNAESFVLSVVLFSALLPLLIALMKAKPRQKYATAAIATTCIAAFFCAAVKSSAGFFCALALVLIAWNFRRRPAFVALIAIALAALALFAVGWIIPRGIRMTEAPFFIMATSYVMYFTWTTFFSYAVPILIIFVLTLQPRMRMESSSLLLYLSAANSQTANSAAPIPSWMEGTGRASRILQWFLQSDRVVQLLTISILGCIFVLFTTPIGDANYYFSAILFALSLLLLPTALCATLRIKLTDNVITRLLAFVLFVHVLQALWTFPVGLWGTVAKLYRMADPKGIQLHTKDEIMASMKMTGTPFSTLRQMVLASPWTQLAQTIKIEAHPLNGKLAVHIPPSADEVWRRLDRGSPWWCMAPHLMVPAETGIFQIRSIAPKSIEQECAPQGISWYGFGKDQDKHRTQAFSETELCALARSFNVTTVYRLLSYKDLSKNSTVKCD